MTIFILLLLGSCIANKVSYEQYKVYRAHPETEKDLKLLKQFVERSPSVEIWNGPNSFDTGVDVMVSPGLDSQFQNLLYTRNIESKIIIENLQNLIHEESRGFQPRCAFGWTQYPTLAQIDAWLYSLPKLYKNVQIITMGSTHEGRNITGAYLSFSRKNRNRGVFLEANMHGNEWITSASTTFMFNELLTSKDPEVRQIAESHDWYLVPVANPDGFVYSHEEDRMWRKTRTSHSWFGVIGCRGADPGRNWDHHWSEHEETITTCTLTYPGPNPFSEPCTKTLSEYLHTIGDKLVAYLSFHSYGQALGIPYAYTSDLLDNYNQTYNIGVEAVKSLAKRYGTEYRVGTMFNLMKPAGGVSIDWVKATFKTPLVYMFNLRDKGKSGYILPPDQIVPTALETLDAIVTILTTYAGEKKCSPLDYD